MRFLRKIEQNKKRNVQKEIKRRGNKGQNRGEVTNHVKKMADSRIIRKVYYTRTIKKKARGRSRKLGQKN